MIGLQKGRNNEAGACHIQLETRLACTAPRIRPDAGGKLSPTGTYPPMMTRPRYRGLFVCGFPTPPFIALRMAFAASEIINLIAIADPDQLVGHDCDLSICVPGFLPL
jgi:hypothetical protein